jgi:hypothetical protein
VSALEDATRKPERRIRISRALDGRMRNTGSVELLSSRGADGVWVNLKYTFFLRCSQASARRLSAVTGQPAQLRDRKQNRKRRGQTSRFINPNGILPSHLALKPGSPAFKAGWLAMYIQNVHEVTVSLRGTWLRRGRSGHGKLSASYAATRKPRICAAAWHQRFLTKKLDRQLLMHDCES